MKGCHSCETAVEIANGKYRDVPWKDLPCASCEVMTGQSYAVEYDENRPSDETMDHGPSTIDRDGKQELVSFDSMVDAMVAFLKLRPEVRDIVGWRYVGMTYPDIAAIQGVTAACVEKRHRRAMEAWPALQALFPVKVAKQGMRKPHQRRETGTTNGHE